MSNEPSTRNAGHEVHRTSPITLFLAWALVLIPLAWGFFSTLSKAALLFQ